ncbi:MAG: hydantoinase/oxoprolinase family protein [Boseongicola sp. SB0677_bin_26]|nr:hydantoinase/oxoprolinase family protein [Boseongicola sp. SB0665_bin_10]MYG26518.1 hydantoinase/oxoprolinase family protein [Boseongicola sp. SB0677_bin_26]
MGKNYRVAADIGGTFTDIVYQDSETGTCGATKVISTPENPALAVLTGISEVVGDSDSIGFFVHGTTVGLNALLTRSGARVALVTNENFRDIYTIQGNDRGEIFSIRWNKPAPLAPVEHTYTLSGRMSAEGREVDPLHLPDLDRLVDVAVTEGYEAIAVALLFSFKNPEHELEAARYLQSRLPGIPIALSHRISPEWREFERISTTVMDAYLAPVVRQYLETLIEALAGRLPGGGLHVMESNGGVMSAGAACETPLQTLLSGPVGGAIGGRALAAATGRANLICVDMGGTSFDASLIVDGQPSTSNETKLEGLPVQMSVVDIHVIGAGGGSIAWEEAAAMRVGPQSAGSKPGPVCYGLGGTEPTVSDANLVLGRLDGSNFAGGSMALDRRAARGALAAMGDRFGMSAEDMAQGVVDIVNSKMADAIRTITVRRGIDPRDFSLVAFGGAGPAQATALAEELRVGEVIIPVHPGAFSAWGMLQTDVRHDFKETLYGFWDRMELSRLEDAFEALATRGRDHLVAEGIAPEDINFERAIDFRYHGQEYVLTIPLADGPIDMDCVRNGFDAAYARQYGHNSPENRVEMANVRLAALGHLPRPESAPPAPLAAKAARARDVYFDGAAQPTQILDRNAITTDRIVRGPAIIEEATATTLLPPAWQARLSEGGHLVLTKGGTS